MSYSLTFQSPWFLLLLALLPALWWYSYRRLAGLGTVRKWIALGLRTLVLLLLVLALAEMQFVRTSDKLTVLYLLDQSKSIPQDDRDAEVAYVNAAIKEQRKEFDRAGAIVFGRDAAIEIPPFDDAVQIPGKIESSIDPEYTNLADAMKLAQASFPEDAAKRIVVITDGNQNLGNAVDQAHALADAGVGIDVLPIRYRMREEVIVERVAIPPDIRRGQPFDIRVVVTNTREPTAKNTGEVAGRLVITRVTGERKDILSDEPITLRPGKNVFTRRQEIENPNFYTYEARFVPDKLEGDLAENNRATAFTHVQGKGRVLLIENGDDKRGEFDTLAEHLRKQELEVEIQPTTQLFTTLAELQPFDAVVLANVPREQFTDGQISMLVRNTQQMGAGLIMLGGPNSFGAGGWAGSEMEKAMPVDFQIKSAKVVPRGALVMVFHASEMAQGNYWQKVIGQKAIEALGPQDYCGVLHYGGMGEEWLWKRAGTGLIEVADSRQQMLARLDRMVPGDMPDFEPGMQMAYTGFANLPDSNKAVKHMIVISDGDPSRPSGSILGKLKNLGVTISTVAIGAHGPAESGLLNSIAVNSGGKFYAVNNPKTLPKIFQREARRVARPLIWEKSPVRPKVKFQHEMLSGIKDPIEPLKGFVLTSKKENPLVETLLTSPLPAGSEDNNTILACWTYGLGKSAAFTSDAGARWTDGWVNLELYDKLFGQMIRWSMRPAGGTGKFTVSADPADGQVRVIINALDKDDEFLNFLAMSGTAVGPDMQPLPMKIEQTAPGRYVGSFAANEAGSYFIMVSPGPGKAPIRTGINVPYSDEYRELEPNEVLLKQLAEMAPKGGKPGKTIEMPPGGEGIKGLLATNTFRHDLAKASSSQDAWHYFLLVASCLFFGDVFVRRVQVNFGWMAPYYHRALNWIMRREEKPAEVVMLDRLKSRKAEVAVQIEQRREAVRFEMPQPDKPADLTVLEEPSAPTPKESKPKTAPDMSQKPEQESYTERLLKAKKKVWEERDKE
ncbi:MAG: VWA domain-containing protein [Pirellulales bacterium]|nr:VWA domain-containing protein [Pirellulales bacterium]